MQIACVLKLGGEFRERHAIRLAESVLHHNPDARITCLSDADFSHPSLTVEPLIHKWRAWWSKIELFRPGLFDGPTLYLDLDTVVIGELPAIGKRFTMLQDVYRPGDWYGSGVMSWQRPPTHIYDAFLSDPKGHMANYSCVARWGDQAFIRDHLGRVPDTFGLEYRSYKMHCRQQVPAGTKVVYFHGKPRPWRVKLRLPA